MRRARVTVINSKGLHARAAARLAKVASDYKSIVKVGQKKMVDGKSILSLMMLAAIKGTVLKIETEGIDEDIAIEAIINLVKSGFDEVNWDVFKNYIVVYFELRLELRVGISSNSGPTANFTFLIKQLFCFREYKVC